MGLKAIGHSPEVLSQNSPHPALGVKGVGLVSTLDGVEGSRLQGGLGYACVGMRQSPNGASPPRKGGDPALS